MQKTSQSCNVYPESPFPRSKPGQLSGTGLSLSVELGKAFRQEKTRYECKHKDFYKGRVGPPRRTGEKEKAALGTGDINGWSITWDKTKEEGALLLVTVSQAATT